MLSLGASETPKWRPQVSSFEADRRALAEDVNLGDTGIWMVFKAMSLDEFTSRVSVYEGTRTSTDM